MKVDGAALQRCLDSMGAIGAQVPLNSNALAACTVACGSGQPSLVLLCQLSPEHGAHSARALAFPVQAWSGLAHQGLLIPYENKPQHGTHKADRDPSHSPGQAAQNLQAARDKGSPAAEHWLLRRGEGDRARSEEAPGVEVGRKGKAWQR